jgi:hypothetical protein
MAAMAFVELVPGEWVQTLYYSSEVVARRWYLRPVLYVEFWSRRMQLRQ